MLPSAGALLAVLVVVVAAILCGRSPLLSNPGPEAGLVLAVVGGVAVALAQAARGSARRPGGFVADWLAGVAVAAVCVLVFLVSTAIGAVVSPSCAENVGRLPMLVLSVPVLLLQAATGTIVGRAVGHRVAAVVLCLVVEVALALALALSLYDEPGFRAASHFFVVIGGDLLRGASLPSAAIGFRVATLLWSAVAVLVGAAVWPAQRKTGLVSNSGDTWHLWILVVVLGAVAIGAHRQARRALVPSHDELLQTYSMQKRRGVIVVHADPLATTPREIDGVLAEAALWHERLADRLGPLSQDDIHVFLHVSREAAEHWTGAAHVDFALPWRREIHIAHARVPHRSLGHELAHVVAGEKSDTLLRVPARFVVLHAAAVTEGVAMALTPELVVSDGLTLREQAAAMRRAGRAPDLRSLFSFTRFFAEEPGRAYVAAGALVEQLVADAGAEGARALGRLYAGDGSLDNAVVDADDLIRRHERQLDETPLPPDAAAFARARFSRPSIFEQSCDPDARAAAREVRALARSGDVAGALAHAAALERSREAELADGTLFELVEDVSRAGDVDASLGILRRLVDSAPSEPERALRRYALGRALWRAGHEREAEAQWRLTDLSLLDVDVQRQLAAARIFAETALRLADEARVSRAALAFFTDDRPGRAGTRLAFAEAVGASASSPEPPAVRALATYIHGRQLVLEGALDDAVRVLRPLVDRGALEGAFREQAVLALGVALVRKDRPDDARALFVQAAATAERPATRLFFRDRADRAARAARAPTAPAVVTATTDPAWADRLLLGIDAAGDL